MRCKFNEEIARDHQHMNSKTANSKRTQSHSLRMHHPDSRAWPNKDQQWNDENWARLCGKTVWRGVPLHWCRHGALIVINGHRVHRIKTETKQRKRMGKGK